MISPDRSRTVATLNRLPKNKRAEFQLLLPEPVSPFSGSPSRAPTNPPPPATVAISRPVCGWWRPARIPPASANHPRLPPFDILRIQWSGISAVKLFQHWFRRHPHPDQEAPASYHWPGHSGRQYEFQVYPLEAGFRSLPGLYIYAKQLADGDWSPIYIAQTRDLHQRLEGHVRLEDAVANGATHLHAHYCNEGQGARCTEEHDLILRWQPVCNDVFGD